MPILPWWIKPLAIALVFTGAMYASWHERGVIDDAAMATYKAEVATASAQFTKQNAQVMISQAQASVTAEQSHVQAITSLNAMWAGILRQRASSSGGKLPKVSAAPRSIDAIPTQCIPLAASTSQDIQQLVDLQNWIRAQQSIHPQ